jgi:hypothetical protein
MERNARKVLSDARAAQHLSPRSFLAGVGAKLLGKQLFSPICERVKIAQKMVKDSPSDKLYDGFINILCEAGGMVEVNEQAVMKACNERLGESAAQSSQ